MNVLFVTNNLYPKLNANSEIAYRLAAVLKEEHGCDVTILGYRDNPRGSEGNPYGVDEYEMKQIGIARSIMARHECRPLKALRLLRHPSAALYLLQSEKDTRYRLKSHYKRAIQYLCKTNRFDCIVCFKNPNDTMAAAIEASVPIPIIAYELDPWEPGLDQSEEDLRYQQYTLESGCDAIITTKLLYPTYTEENSAIPIDNVYQAEFPNIVRHVLANSGAGDNRIHCVFAGTLYGDIRNPRYTIDLFSELVDDGIVLDIYGNDGGCFKGLQLPNTVVYHGEVPSDEAQSHLYAADVVLNIGNTLMDQMPSKLLTCLATGKPILNIVKSENCPTLRYTSKYPLSLNLVETDVVSEDAVKATRAFCNSACGQTLGFETVQDLYREATPAYVGRQLYDVINSTTRRVWDA